MLTLVVPGCCGPLPENSAALEYLDPSLQQLTIWTSLSRADKTPAAENFQQQLASLFDHSNEIGVFPYAALDLLGEGGSPETKNWLHADPVCMQADMDHAILFDAQSLQLTDDEADQLLAELNAHFSQDGIQLQRGSAANWYLALNADDKIATSALHDVVGRNVNQFMPTGVDAAVWKRFMNEAQMLLHMSEVNQQREARGQLPVNSLWLWGEGRLPAAANDAPSATQPGFDLLWANNAGARGLAMQHRILCEALPPDPAACLRLLSPSAPVCLVLDDLFSSISYGDVGVWQEQLTALHETWLQPLLQHCLSYNIPVQLYPCNGTSYHLRTSNKFRVWRRGKINTHVTTHA